MKETEFNLLEQPWIRVIKSDCTVEEVSLTDALLRAHEYQALRGELPTQDVAVLRLLLAVLHTVFSRVDENGNEAPFETAADARKRWKALWDLGHFPETPIRMYLQKYRERFWLFHPERPFYQVNEAQNGTAYYAPKLNGELSESSNKVRLFPSRSQQTKNGITYAEAARWLLHVNAFDDTSAKPKQKGLPSPGVGWMGKLGLIYASGVNLYETLMLNLTFLQDGQQLYKENHPCWELEQPHIAERVEIPIPDNQAELLTLQSRRLLLNRTENTVTGFCLLGGDFCPRENAFIEQMTAWRKLSGKGAKADGYQPRRHDASQQMWREFSALFVPQEGSHRPGVVLWTEMLKKKRLIDKKRMISYCIASVQYGDKDFFVTDIFQDSLTFHADLLSDLGIAWQMRISAEIERCEQLAEQIGYLFSDLVKAAGGSGNIQSAKEQLYYRLDKPFRDWLEQLDPQSMDIDEQMKVWQTQAKRIGTTLAQEMVDQAGTSAFIGREVTEKVKGKEHTMFYSSPKAYNQFLYNVRKIYP